MENHFSLIKNTRGTQEVRKLPRFPFCYLTFKCDDGENDRVFEVVDISPSGIQLNLKSSISLKNGSLLSGHLHWAGDKIEIKAQVIWQNQQRVGLEFANMTQFRKEIEKFLTIPRFAKHLKPIHEMNFGAELPTNLKYWLRADGPCEVFIWNHPRVAFECFQILIMEHFVEWQDGIGLKTGRVLSKRNVDSPLLTEDEFVFLFDHEIDGKKLKQALSLIENTQSEYLDKETFNFLFMKLGQ